MIVWFEYFWKLISPVAYIVIDNFCLKKVETKEEEEAKEVLHKANDKQKPPGRSRRHHQRSQCKNTHQSTIGISPHNLNYQFIGKFYAAMGAPGTNKIDLEKEKAETKRFGPIVD